MIAILNLVVALLYAWQGPATTSPAWVPLADPVRVTYYGPEYRGGELTASGIRYAPDADIVALGPDLLAEVRRHYAAEARIQGNPLWWGWAPGPKLKFQGIAGGYPRHACFQCEPAWWGYYVRLCRAEPVKPGEAIPARLHGRSDGLSSPVPCLILRVADTGSDALQVDLPDKTWERFGYVPSQGVFTGTLEVLAY